MRCKITKKSPTIYDTFTNLDSFYIFSVWFLCYNVLLQSYFAVSSAKLVIFLFFVLKSPLNFFVFSYKSPYLCASSFPQTIFLEILHKSAIIACECSDGFFVLVFLCKILRKSLNFNILHNFREKSAFFPLLFVKKAYFFIFLRQRRKVPTQTQNLDRHE